MTISSIKARVFIITPTICACGTDMPAERAARYEGRYLAAQASSTTTAHHPHRARVLRLPILVRRPV